MPSLCNRVTLLRCLMAALTLCLLAPERAGARSNSKAGTEIVLLGTGGGPKIRKERAEPSSLVIVDGRPYLIDCGVGALRRIVQAGIKPDAIRTIFITHHHSDHDLDLVNIMARDFFRSSWTGSKTVWNIYGPPGTRKMVSLAEAYLHIPFDTFAAESLVKGSIKAHFLAHDINHAGLVYQDGKIRITAVENTHYALMPPKFRKHMKSYAYRIVTPDGVIVFTGDTGPSRALARFAHGANVLVSEVMDEQAALKGLASAAAAGHWSAGHKADLIAHMKHEHLSSEEVGELAASAQVKAVLLHHFVPGLDGENPQDYVTGVKRYYTGPVFAGHDLGRYCLDASTGLHRC